MRFKLYFKLEKEEIPMQYRKTIISYFKHSLEEYNQKYYQKYYNGKDPIIKQYAFSAYYKQQKIEKDKIILEDQRLEINITTSDYETGIILYNSFNKQKHKKYSLNNNSMTLENITTANEKEITTEKISVKFQAPLCVRLRENSKDYYYSYENEKFEETLKINIKEQLKITNMPTEIVDTFTIKPIKAKKVLIKFYEKCIECSTGTFELSGNKELLKYLYKSGIGSKHSAGFGMFQII